jgi:type I restriction enzyme, S subunit
LVLQDPNDEPASELLKRIAAVRTRLMKAGEIGKQKELSPLKDYELPFALPLGWDGCAIGSTFTAITVRRRLD